jgi:uncharacterized protein YodC (DUF2158 family)
MSETFKVGDEVKLKSGGPAMTVEEVNEGDILCVWFDGKKADRQIFQSATLKKTYS